MKTIREIDLKNKRVILRCDYNVPVSNGNISDDLRIIKSLETINYLLINNCKIVILSHLGRVKNENDKKENSLKIVAQYLSKLINRKIIFLDNCYGNEVKKIVDNANLGEIILLENTRFMDLYGNLESQNNKTLSKFWASLGDIYINDAFGVTHRMHASTAGISNYLPSGIGLLVEQELNNLEPLINISQRPFTIFMGGAKVEEKLSLIKKLLPKCDFLILGGGILNSFLKAKGEEIYDSLATNDENILKELQILLKEYETKIIMAQSFVMENNKILDINPDTYEKNIYESKLIFVNGTPGKFENEKFSEGTKKLFKMLKDSPAHVIIGGGDTANAVSLFGYEKSFDFISSGGGATLEYIANGKINALEKVSK